MVIYLEVPARVILTHIIFYGFCEHNCLAKTIFVNAGCRFTQYSACQISPTNLASNCGLPLMWKLSICCQSRSTPTSGPPKVSARAPAHRSYHFRGVKLKSCIKKIHHNLYISKQANVRIKHADTEGASHKKFGTDARVQ